MAPVAAKTSQKAGDAPKAPASASRVDEFFAFIDQYCAQEKYKELRATIRKVDGLQEEIGSLRIAYKENLAEHAQLRNEFNADKLSYEQRLEHEKNRYDQVLKDKEAAERAVKAEKSNCAKLKSDILSRDEDIKRLTHTVKKHETQVAKLDNKYKAQAAELDKANGQGVQLSAELREMKAKVTTQSEELVNTRQDLEKVQSFIVPLANLEDVRDQVFVQLPAYPSHLLLPTLPLTITAAHRLMPLLARPWRSFSPSSRGTSMRFSSITARHGTKFETFRPCTAFLCRPPIRTMLKG